MVTDAHRHTEDMMKVSVSQFNILSINTLSQGQPLAGALFSPHKYISVTCFQSLVSPSLVTVIVKNLNAVFSELVAHE